MLLIIMVEALEEPMVWIAGGGEAKSLLLVMQLRVGTTAVARTARRSLCGRVRRETCHTVAPPRAIGIEGIVIWMMLAIVMMVMANASEMN